MAPQIGQVSRPSQEASLAEAQEGEGPWAGPMSQKGVRTDTERDTLLE